MKAICTLVAVLTITASLSSTADGDILPKLELDYELLSGYLVAQLPEDDSIEANLEAAQKLLDTKIAGTTIPNSPTVDVLRQFVALGEALEKPCTSESVWILRRNDETTGEKASEDPWERVEVVINQAMAKHGQICTDVYKAQNDKASKRLDSDVEALKDLFLGPVIADKVVDGRDRKGGQEPQVLSDYSLLKENDFLYQKFSLNLIKTLAKDDPGAKYLAPIVDQSEGVPMIKADNVRQLHDKYLIGSCNKFIDTFEFMYKFNTEHVWGLMNLRRFGGQFFDNQDRFILCVTLTRDENDAFFEKFIKFLQAEHSTSNVV